MVCWTGPAGEQEEGPRTTLRGGRYDILLHEGGGISNIEVIPVTPSLPGGLRPMADLEIIEGDLEKLSTSIYAVYADVTDAHGVFAAVGNAESSMPGSSSASSKISSAVTTLDDQRRDLKRRYKDFSTDVKTAADAHWASEEQAKTSLESAGLLDGERPQTDAERQAAAFLAIRARLE